MMSNACTIGGMSWAPRSKAVDRDWGSDTTGCTILHVDMDAFFASLEAARHPEYAGRPIIVGVGGQDIHGVVSTASYEARKYGVHSAMPILKARKLCPFGVYLPVDHPYYSAVSKKIFGGIVASITDRIEQVSVDEAYVDVSGALLQWASPVAIGRWIRAEVARRFHITCSVGIASNKLIAKLASTNAKPNGMLLVPKARNADFVALLPIASLNGVGPATAERLRQWGVTTVRQLRELTRGQLVHAVHSQAAADWLYEAARGNGPADVTPVREEKSVSVERTYPGDLVTREAVEEKIDSEADEVGHLLRSKGLVCRTVNLKLRFADLSYVTRARTIEMPTDQAAVIAPVARSLFRSYAASKGGNRTAGGQSSDSVQDAGALAEPARLPFVVRLVGVGASSLSKTSQTPVQPSLFETSGSADDASGQAASLEGMERRQRSEAAERALDSVRSRFGSASAHLGV